MNAITIYEKHPTADAYRVGGFYSPYALVATEKRFSDAELAAEYWARMGNVEWWTGRPENTVNRNFNRVVARVKHRTEVTKKFATRPHASENDYQ